MTNVELLARLRVDMESTADEAVVVAAKELAAQGEYGTPAGVYPLKGGQAAFRLGRYADAAILLGEGLLVAKLHSQVWTELLASRSIAGIRLGIYPDVVFDGGLFLSHAHRYPALAKWVPHVHHAIGQARDCMRQYAEAVPHHRQAAEQYADPSLKSQALANWAYALAMSGRPDEAEQVLDQAFNLDGDVTSQFARRATFAIIKYCQGSPASAVLEAERAEELAQGHEDALQNPLLELRYWLARATWALGDGLRAARVGVQVAVLAQQCGQRDLSDAATDLLIEIRDKGGLSHA